MEDAVTLDEAAPATVAGAFKVTVRLNDRINVNLAIDTASYDTVIPTQAAHQLKLPPFRSRIPYRSVNGPIPSEEALLKSLVFGPVLIRNQDVSILIRNHDVFYATKQHEPAVDHLGLDILSRFRMLIDFPAHKLYLKPEQKNGAVLKTNKNANSHNHAR